MLNEFTIEILDDFPFPSQSSTTTFQVDIPSDPTPGTFEADINDSHFNIRWASLDEFEAWRVQEQKTNSIEIRHTHVFSGGAHYQDR